MFGLCHFHVNLRFERLNERAYSAVLLGLKVHVDERGGRFAYHLWT